MRLIKFIIILILFVYGNTVNAQQTKPLTIGDECPDFSFDNLVNFPQKSARLSDFKDKLVILDFWATWCSPCVAFIPKAEELQKKFQDRLQFIPITYEDSRTFTNFAANFKKFKGILPASETGNISLRQYFNYLYVPHYVWIKNKKVVAITGYQEVTEQNIQLVINNSAVLMPTKNDPLRLNVKYDKPVFVATNPIIEKGVTNYTPVDEDMILYHSTLTRENRGFRSGADYSLPNTFATFNASIGGLYRDYANGINGGSGFVYVNRTVIETDSVLARNIQYDTFFDPIRKNAPKEEERKWALSNAYCYEITTSPMMDTKAKFHLMLNELNNYFGLLYNITGGIEKRKMKCLVLIRTTADDKMAAKQSNDFGSTPVNSKDKFTLVVKNKSVAFFLSTFRQTMQHLPPIEDGTGYTGKIDIAINTKLSDVNLVNAELEKYGLKFVEEEREIDAVVIKYKK